MNENEAVLLLADEYTRNAEAYDAAVVPVFAPFAERLVARASLKPHAAVLDVATGTGVTAILAAKALQGTGLVVGIDLADGALTVAQTNAARAGLRTTRFELLDARNIVYRGGAFDAALCSFGLDAAGHAQTLQEVCRVLRDGGAFHLLLWGAPNPGSLAWRESLLAHRTKAPTADTARVREASETMGAIAEEAGLRDAKAVVAKLRMAGFRDPRADPLQTDVEFAGLDAFVAHFLGFGTNEREWREMGDAARSAMRASLEERLRDWRHGTGYRIPWNLVYYDARK